MLSAVMLNESVGSPQQFLATLVIAYAVQARRHVRAMYRSYEVIHTISIQGLKPR